MVGLASASIEHNHRSIICIPRVYMKNLPNEYYILREGTQTICAVSWKMPTIPRRQNIYTTLGINEKCCSRVHHISDDFVERYECGSKSNRSQCGSSEWKKTHKINFQAHMLFKPTNILCRQRHTSCTQNGVLFSDYGIFRKFRVWLMSESTFTELEIKYDEETEIVGAMCWKTW